MSTSMSAVFVAAAGLEVVTAFAMTQKRTGPAGPISLALGVLQIPAAISLLWCLALEIGWWTIAVFIGTSLAAGFIMGPIFAKNLRSGDPEGIEKLLGLQTLFGLGFAIASVLCWFLR